MKENIAPHASNPALSNAKKSYDKDLACVSKPATSSAVKQVEGTPPNASRTIRPDTNIPPSFQSITHVNYGVDKSYDDNDKLNRPRQSLMQQQFAIVERHPELSAAIVRKLPPSESRRLYFFYGSLMNSKRLRSVLNLEDEPVLRPAHIEGFRSMLWGPYPALVFACGEIVHGQAYQISSHGEVAEQVAKLEYYETEKYERQPVMLEFDDGTESKGYTFVWSGNKDELREGNFDLGGWQETT